MHDFMNFNALKIILNIHKKKTIIKQAISARVRVLCQLTVCFEFQIRSKRRNGHKSCALQMILRSKVAS